MFEVRIHGRGGQGVVTAAGLLSEAAFEEGRYAQAFPSFGSERTGAPVVAYCRGRYCVLSFEAVARLRQAGFEARRIEDGIPRWMADEQPLEGAQTRY